MADAGGPFTPSAPSSTASQSDILTALKNQVVATNLLAAAYTQLTPSFTSGQLTASVFGTLVQSGLVRLLGISIVSGGAGNGGLYDAPANNPSVGQQIGVMLTTPGYYPVQMIFLNGILQDTEAFSGVMKIGYGFTQPLIRQVHEQMLKLAEGFTGLKRLNW